LAHGAVSGGQVGVHCLISASLALYNWPDEKNIQSSIFRPATLLQQLESCKSMDIAADNVHQILEKHEIVSIDPSVVLYRRALRAMSATFQSALIGVSRLYKDQLENHKKIIDAKVDALKCLEDFPEILTDWEDFPWTSLKSAKEIFGVLVSRGHISAALRLKNFDCCRNILDVEAMVEAILLIKSSTDPALYCRWVYDVLLQLKVNSSMAFLILKWAVQMAHSFDEECFHGIEASITLLSVSFTFPLNIQINFISYSYLRFRPSKIR
jgi:hypothetical protein